MSTNPFEDERYDDKHLILVQILVLSLTNGPSLFQLLSHRKGIGSEGGQGERRTRFGLKNLSQMDDPSSEISCKLPMLSVQEDNSCQFSDNVVVEKFNNHETGEVRSDQVPLLNTADGEISLAHNNTCPNTSISDTFGDNPTLSAIRKMDSVARVSMLRKRISSVVNMSSQEKEFFLLSSIFVEL